MKVRRGFELVSYDLSPLSMQCALDLLFHQMGEDESAPNGTFFTNPCLIEKLTETEQSSEIIHCLRIRTEKGGTSTLLKCAVVQFSKGAACTDQIKFYSKEYS